jgi:cysteine synthase
MHINIKSTGPEIWEQTKGITLSGFSSETEEQFGGIAGFLKRENPNISILLMLLDQY